MPPRPQLTGAPNLNDGPPSPPEFTMNQIHAEGRGMRHVRENPALSGIRAEMQKNLVKGARARATRQANVARRENPPPNITSTAHSSTLDPGHILQPQDMMSAGGNELNRNQYYELNQHTLPFQVQSQMPGPPAPTMYYLNHQQQPFGDHNLTPISSRNPSMSNFFTDSVNDNIGYAFNLGTNKPDQSFQQLSGTPPLGQDGVSVSDEDKENMDGGHNLSDGDGTSASVIVPMGQGLHLSARDINLKRKRVDRESVSMPITPTQHLNPTTDLAAAREVMSPDLSDKDPPASPINPAGRPTRSIRVLPEDARQIVSASWELLRAHLTKVNPWPETSKPGCNVSSGVDQYKTLAYDFWYEACDLLKLENSNPTAVEIKRILDRTPTFRGQVRDKAGQLVGHVYGFVNNPAAIAENRELYASLKDKFWYTAGQLVGHVYGFVNNPAAIAENRELYASLKDKFWYTDPRDTTIRNTMYHNPIIQQVLNTTWFGKGFCARSKYFAGDTELPLVTIAFILTAVENALDAWRSGSYDLVVFSSKDYHSCYVKHLTRITNWKAYCVQKGRDLAGEIQVSLLENARLSIGDDQAAVREEGEESEDAMYALFAANSEGL